MARAVEFRISVRRLTPAGEVSGESLRGCDGVCIRFSPLNKSLLEIGRRAAPARPVHPPRPGIVGNTPRGVTMQYSRRSNRLKRARPVARGATLPGPAESPVRETASGGPAGHPTDVRLL